MMEDVANDHPKDERCQKGQTCRYTCTKMDTCTPTQCARTLKMYLKMDPAFKSDDTTGWPQEYIKREYGREKRSRRQKRYREDREDREAAICSDV